MSPSTTTESDVQAVAAAIRANDSFLVVAHENPDGDALGSMLATSLALRALGKDVVMYLSGDAPTPGEYGFLDLSDLRRRLPDDLEERVLLARRLCQRTPHRSRDRRRSSGARLVVNVDHHHDNSRFGDLNLIVDDASSTAEIVRDVLASRSTSRSRPRSPRRSTSALVTDTGRFQYTNTTPKALRLAAELVEAGADVHGIFRHVYETVQFAKLKLLARALERAAALRERPPRRLVSPEGRLRRRSVPRSRTRRGSSTTSAASKARRWSR